MQLHLDNKAAIDTAYTNPSHHSRIQYCSPKTFWIRELVEGHKIVVPFVELDKNITGFLTKPLAANKIFDTRRCIMKE